MFHYRKVAKMSEKPLIKAKVGHKSNVRSSLWLVRGKGFHYVVISNFTIRPTEAATNKYQ